MELREYCSPEVTATKTTTIIIAYYSARVQVLAVQEFSALHVVQTGSVAHSASYPMSTGGSFPGGKAAWA
jgi:hypothetical protein